MGRKKEGLKRKRKEQAQDGLPKNRARVTKFRHPWEKSPVLQWLPLIVPGCQGAGRTRHAQPSTCITDFLPKDQAVAPLPGNRFGEREGEVKGGRGTPVAAPGGSLGPGEVTWLFSLS